jgi:hypothetical protein
MHKFSHDVPHWIQKQGRTRQLVHPLASVLFCLIVLCHVDAIHKHG